MFGSGVLYNDSRSWMLTVTLEESRITTCFYRVCWKGGAGGRTQGYSVIKESTMLVLPTIGSPRTSTLKLSWISLLPVKPVIIMVGEAYSTITFFITFLM